MRMEILTLAMLIVCSLLAGSCFAVTWVWAQMKTQQLASLAELAKVKADFSDILAKVTEANNAWASQVVKMQDQLLAHEMMLKGQRR